MSDGRANNLPGSQRVVIFTTAQVVAYHYTQVLPSLRLTGKVQVEDKIIASGGFANLRHGRYMGNLVAVKTMRVAAQGDLSRMRRVSIDVGHPGPVSCICPRNFVVKPPAGRKYPIQT